VRRPNEWVSYVRVRYEIYAPSFPLAHLLVVQQLMAQPAHTTTGTGKRSGYQQAGLHSFPGPGTRSAPIPSRPSLPLPPSGPKVAQVVPPSASAQLTIPDPSNPLLVPSLKPIPAQSSIHKPTPPKVAQVIPFFDGAIPASSKSPLVLSHQPSPIRAPILNPTTSHKPAPFLAPSAPVFKKNSKSRV
jgi:hypothetical protein